MRSIDALLTTAAEKIKAAQGRIGQLRLLRFPSENPEVLISLFSAICTLLEENLNENRARFQRTTDENSQRLIKENIERTVLLVRTLSSQLRYLEGAAVQRTPWSLVPTIEKIAQDLLPGTLLIVRPQWHYDYGSLEVLERYKGKLRFLLSESNYQHLFNNLPCSRVYIISFPGLERKNVLLHVNFGHEIGHPIVEEFLEREGGAEQQDIKLEVRKLRLPLTMQPLEEISWVGETTERVQQIRRRALEEIAADLISIRLFGPAAVFALNEVAMFSDSLDEVSQGTLYPPWRTRLRFALEELDWSTWNGCLQKSVEDFHWKEADQVLSAVQDKIHVLRQITDDNGDKKAIQRNDLIRIAYQSIDKSVAEVKLFLDERLKQTYFCAPSEDLCREILCLVERLAYDTPPNEILDSSFTNKSVLDWSGLLCQLKNSGNLDTPDPVKRIKELLRDETKRMIDESTNDVTDDVKFRILSDFNDILKKRSFYLVDYFRGIDLDPELMESLTQGFDGLSRQETVGLNRQLLNVVFKDKIANREDEVKTAQVPAILNAGWFYKAMFLPSMFGEQGTEYFLRLDILNRLVLRAIEMSHLQEEYQTRNKEED